MQRSEAEKAAAKARYLAEHPEGVDRFRRYVRERLAYARSPEGRRQANASRAAFVARYRITL